MENKTKRPLQAGDRVKVYGNLKGNTEANGIIATIVENDEKYGPPLGWVTVVYSILETNYKKYVHPRQCVRLKPKPEPQKQERVHNRVWLFDGSTMVYDCHDKAMQDAKNYRYAPLREYVYLKPGEIITSKSKLAESWDKNVYIKGGDVSESKESESFRIFCKALGVE